MEVARRESFFDVFYSPEYGGYTTIARQAALAGCKEVAQKAIDLEIEETKETTFFLDTLTYAAEVYFILGNDRNLYGTIDRIFSQNPVHANSDNSPCLIRCAEILAQNGDYRIAEDILFSVLNQTRTYILSMMQVYISYGLAFGSRELKLIRDGKNYFIDHSISVTSDIRTGTNEAVI